MASKRTTKLNAARKNPKKTAGPHGSFPIMDAKSVRSAYNLAGHAADPAAVRARVKKLAKRVPGGTAALPMTAKKKRR